MPLADRNPLAAAERGADQRAAGGADRRETRIGRGEAAAAVLGVAGAQTQAQQHVAVGGVFGQGGRGVRDKVPRDVDQGDGDPRANDEALGDRNPRRDHRALPLPHPRC
eukprot:5860356-Prymnesium_polylepis.1